MRNWSNSLLLGLIGVFVVGEMGFGKDGAELRSTSEAMELRRGALALEWRVPAGADGVKCVVVLASGDGGWSGWEEAVSRRLVRHGCLVVGVDMQKYAATDFDEEILGSDFAKIAGAGVERGGGKDLPVLYVGWSMGAVEVVAAAAYEGRPANLKGILLISAGKRGRFGLRLPDRAGVPPYGAGTF
ncbi:MAG: virulence factor, partial [Chthoniobacterales bacterium]|nr:virulence factor [Chthoniobacterales bacterium]